jgi:flagellar biosynthetic protein FlhB
VSDAPEKDEKVHDASPQRLNKAREEGNVLRAKEIVTVGMIGAGVSAVLLGGPFAFRQLQQTTRDILLEAAHPLSVERVGEVTRSIGLDLGLVLGPFFLLLTTCAVVLNIMQSGVVFTFKPLEPKPNKVSPIAGIKRIFSAKGMFEAFKAFVKLGILVAIGWTYVSGEMDVLTTLHMLPTTEALAEGSGILGGLLIRLVGALLVVAAADFAFEKHKHASDLKMTEKEVRDESKESEGDPHMKGKRKAKARELAGARRPTLLEAVGQADVVVTNPTHYAIALVYDVEAGGAPRVLVKGIRKRALKIKGLALEMGTPTVENRPLARALYAAVDEGMEIPETLYAAVAAVLAEVYRLRDRS